MFQPRNRYISPVLLVLKWDVKVRIGHASRPSLVIGVSQDP